MQNAQKVPIDASFFRGIVRDTTDRAMVEAINRLEHRLGIKTITEDVKDAKCIVVLIRMGFDYGYTLGEPEVSPVMRIDTCV